MQRQIKSCTHCRQHKVRCDASKSYPKPCSRCAKFNLTCQVDQNFKPRRGGQVELLREHLAKIQEQIKSMNNGTGTEIGEDGDEILDDTGVESGNEDEPGIPRKRQRTISFVDRPEAAAIKMEAAEDEPDIADKAIEASIAERMAIGGRLEPVSGPYTLDSVTLSEKKAEQLLTTFMTKYWPYIPIFETNSAGELYARSGLLFWSVMTTASLSEESSELYISCVSPLKRLVAQKCLMETTRSSSVVQALLILCNWPLPSEKMLEDMSPRYAALAHSMGLQLGMHKGKFIYEFSRNQQLMPNAVKWRSRTWVQSYITRQLISASTGLPADASLDSVIDGAMHDTENPLSPRTLAVLKLSVFYAKIISLMGSSLGTEDGLMEPNARCPSLELLRVDLETMFPPRARQEDPVVEIAIKYMEAIIDSFAFLPETPPSHQSGFIVDAFQSCTKIVTLVRKLVGTRRIMEFPTLIRNACSFAALILFRLQLLPQLPAQYVTSARESVVTIHRLYRNISPSWLDTRVNNDISRIAKILESLNHVMITHPEMLESRRLMRRMRSHLTFSIFYELVYIIHEARRRNAQRATGAPNSPSVNGSIASDPDPLSPALASDKVAQVISAAPAMTRGGNSSSAPPQSSTSSTSSHAANEVAPPAGVGVLHQMIHSEAEARHRNLNPLPLFNNISLDSYVSSTVVSPNGTTVTKLMPADAADGPSDARLVNVAPTGVPDAALDGTATASSHASAPIVGFEDHPVYPLTGLGSNGHVGSGPSTSGTVNSGSTGPQPQGDMMGDVNQILEGLQWMNTESDDFLGWMLPRNE